MKLLFDQNLSPLLVEMLGDIFQDSDHVFLLDLDTVSDHEIRAFAAENGFVVVTKDADYGELHSLLGGPPPVIWIRRGNCSTQSVEKILRGHFADISQLELNSDVGVLTLY